MRRVLPNAESLTVEFKSDRKKYSDSDIFDAVVAFANTEGGELFLGIEDDGTITGAHKDHLNPLTVSAYIANNTVPPVSVRAEIVNESLPVLRLSIPKAYGGLVATSAGKVMRRRMMADGKPENVPMYPTETVTRLSDLRLLDYSALPLAEATIDDIDPVEIGRLRQIILSYDGDHSLLELTDEDMLKALAFVKEQNGMRLPTVAGMLMVGKTESIKRFVPTHAAAFQVLRGTDVQMNDDFILPILASVERFNTYLAAWNPEHEIEMGLFRMPAPDFNKRALREAMINAFSHRDYTKMGRVRIAIADEGMTIANPGGFIEGVSVATLLTAEPHGRNPLLADALKRVGLAEKTGRGIDRIFEGSLIYGSLLPDYSGSTSVTVSLFLPRCQPDYAMAKMISDEQRRLGHPLPLNSLLVLNKLKDIPRSGVHQLAQEINLTDTIVHMILEKSMEMGLVEAYGSGRGRNYSLAKSVYHTQSGTAGYVRQADIDETRHLELILSMARSNAFVSRADVVQLLHVNENQAYRLLKKLVNANVLECVNKGRYAKYRMRGTTIG